MNLNHSILLSVGYGLISTSKFSESITHQKNSIKNLNINDFKPINIGFITRQHKISLNRRNIKSKSEDSSNPDNYNYKDNNSDNDSNLNYDISKKFESIIQANNESKLNNQLDSDLDKINLNEDLYKLISAHSEIVKKDGDKDELSKYDWFNDEPMDSSDEELVTEYYETKLPDYKTLYKQLDPVGIRDYVDQSNLADKNLGRVYEVGESLLDDNKSTNIHSFDEILEKAKQKRLEYIEAQKELDKSRENVYEEYNKGIGTKEEAKENENEEEKDYCLEDDKEFMEKYEKLLKKRDEVQENKDEYLENYEGVNEFDFGEEFKEDSDDIVMEDEMCRFILEIPIRKWVKDEAKEFENSLKKLEKSKKYYKENEKERYITDFRKIFTETPLTTLGIFDNDEDYVEVEVDKDNKEKGEIEIEEEYREQKENKIKETKQEYYRDQEHKVEKLEPEEYDHLYIENILNTSLNRKKIKDLYIKEYKHSDLLNDIDKYEKSEYPEIIKIISKKDVNQPVFILDKDSNGETKDKNTEQYRKEEVKDKGNKDYHSNYYNLDGNLSVYLGIPKNFIKFDDLDSVVICDSAVFRRSYDVYTGRVIEKIPLVEEYHTAAIVLPNQAGYRDQNIRYLADELAVNSKGLVFVPDIPVMGKENKEWYFIYLNRLLKMIQSVYKVDRISFVALGDQGNLILDYISKSMDKTISYYKSLYEGNNNRDGEYRNRKEIENKDNERKEEYKEKLKEKELDPEEQYKILNKGIRLSKEKNDKIIEFLEKYSTERAQELIRRQSIPLIEDLLNGIENIKLSQSHQIAMKAKDVNFIKPISKMLQSIVFYDSCNIDFEKLISLSIPTLIIQSNRTNLIDGILSSEKESFVKIKGKVKFDPKYEGISMFDHTINEIPEKLKELIDKETTFRYIATDSSLKNRTEKYYITTYHRGIDIVLTIFKEASPHFYMKKPNSPKLEYQAFKDSLICCADWIRSWSF